MLCRHRHKSKVNRPRMLCWSCYYTPGVRDLYPPARPRGVGHSEAAVPAPTAARPGSPEKVAVLEQRARDGQALFHTDDARMTI